MKTKLKICINEMKISQNGREKMLISDINLDFEEDNFISILGPSAAGKTTLLRIIAGIENKYKGEVLLDSELVTKPSTDIQIVFQNNILFPWKTVKSNLVFALNERSLRKQKIIDSWLNKLEIEEQANAYPKTLSGGEKGRVAFARVFLNPPRVLLLDEPFRNLDIRMKFNLQSILVKHLQEYRDVKTILVSHSIDDAVYLSDRIVVVDDNPMRVIFSEKNRFKYQLSDHGDRKVFSDTIAECLLTT